MAVNPFVMPKLAMGMNQGTVNEWLVKDGDFVEKGQAFATVETEKVAYDLEAPEAGYFKGSLAAGETVAIETLICYFADSADELANISESSAPAEAAPAATESADNAPVEAPKAVAADTQVDRSQRIKATGIAKKLAADLGVDLYLVKGTGPQGRIKKQDVLDAAEAAKTAAPATAPVASQPISEGLSAKARVPYAGLRAAIGKNMVDQVLNRAMTNQNCEADVSEMLVLRKQLVAMEKQLGTKISVNALFIKAIACAARKVPICNASLMGEEIVIWDQVNVGFAITLPSSDGYTESLMVPVIKGADRLSVSEIDIEMKRLIGLARDGKLTPADMKDSTVTFTTTAGLAPAGTSGSPILNGDNVVILGVGGAKRKPAEYQGEIALRDMAPVMMTFDHRVVDGAPAARFLKHVAQYLEQPALMLV